MSKIDITTPATLLSNGMLKTAAALNPTLQVVTDNVGNNSTLLLSTTISQFSSTLRIQTDSAELLDLEDTGTNNRFNINRSSQKINLDFASKPSDLTTVVGAIRTAKDGTNLSDVLTFLENGSVYNNGGGTLSSNTAFGQSALVANTTGADNAAFGLSALSLNTTGQSNIALGRNALKYNTTGNYNVALGYRALYSNTTGNYNVALGQNALQSNTTGYNNVALGNSALKCNTVGFGNIALGTRALYSNTTGNNNVALGLSALYYNTTGNHNVALGANVSSGNYSGSLILGSGAAANMNGQLALGSSGYPLGPIVTETKVTNRTLAINLNGNLYKMLLYKA
jgi:hypothetical protein